VAAAAPGIPISENPNGVCGEKPANRPKAVVIRTRRKPEGHKKLIAAVALVAYLVQPGDTLSGIAASHGTSLAAVQAANTKIANPDMIYAGQTVSLPEGSSAAQGPVTSQSATTPKVCGMRRNQRSSPPRDASVSACDASIRLR